MKNKEFDDFDKDFDRAQKFIFAWFIFVALIVLTFVCAFLFAAYKVFVFLGIM